MNYILEKKTSILNVNNDKKVPYFIRKGKEAISIYLHDKRTMENLF